MDEETFNRVVTEVSNFYRTITTPFLNRMSDNDRENALLWSQKIMDLKNYDSLTKYLTYLTFMIIKGRFVTPFDSDPRTSQIPPLPVHVGETKMLDFIEKIVASAEHQQNPHSIASMVAVSSDDMAFLSTQPVPGVGIRMYLAASEQPFATWSKAEGASQAMKFENVPARDVVDSGLAIAKEKFYSYLDQIEKLNKQNGTRNGEMRSAKFQKRAAQAGGVPSRYQDTNKSTSDGSLSDISYDYGSLIETLNRSERTDGAETPIGQQDVSRASRDTTSSSNRIFAGRDPALGLSGVTNSTTTIPPNVEKFGSCRNRHSEALSNEEQRRGIEIDRKYERWFREPQYTDYREEIESSLRGGMKIDAIRRNIHSHVRKQHDPFKELPLYAHDSEDEAVPYEIRSLHLRQRYADVLKNEYGIVDEAELYYLLGLSGLSEKNMKEARELIKYAEEGLIDDDFRRKFHSVQGRTCSRILTLIDELLQSVRKSANSSENQPHVSAPKATSSNQTPIASSKRNASTHSGNRIRSMPHTSLMDDHRKDIPNISSRSDQSSIENEPEPTCTRNIEQVDDSTNTTEQSDETNNSTQDPSNRNQSQQPDGAVYPQCPRENCD